MLYRTTDASTHGDGIGRDLTASEIDGNFWELRKAINDLIANPGQPIDIASITLSGDKLTFTMSDGSTIGPVTLPSLAFRWRDVWAPSIAYAKFDVFKVVGVGLYMVIDDHISPAVFDPNYIVPANSQPAYLELLALMPPQNLIYDVGFYYPGLLSAVTSDVHYLYQEPVARKILLPKIAGTGCAHQAYLQTPASTAAQTYNIYRDDVVVGTVTFAIGANVGVVTITTDDVFDIGHRLAVGKALVADATAAGLSVVFAAQQMAL